MKQDVGHDVDDDDNDVQDGHSLAVAASLIFGME